jgi:hypothetical protein
MLTWIMLLALLHAGEGAPVLSVCDLLRAGPKYKGQMVTVRGQLNGTDEGLWLVAVGCSPLKYQGQQWREKTAIFLTPIGSPLAEDPQDRAAGDRSSNPVGKVEPVNSVGTGGGEVIVFGRFETRNQFEIVRLNDGTAHPVGYGHLEMAPAQIVYRRIAAANRAKH